MFQFLLFLGNIAFVLYAVYVLFVSSEVAAKDAIRKVKTMMSTTNDASDGEETDGESQGCSNLCDKFKTKMKSKGTL